MNLAALGARVSLVGVVGCDDGGTELLRQLEAAGVDTTPRPPGSGHANHHQDPDQQWRPAAAALR